MNKKILLVVFFSLTFYGLGQAKAKSYRILSQGISLEVPYTLGTHQGQIHHFSEIVNIDESAEKIEPFKFSIPIKNIDMGKPKMNCHMQESLGLDYATSDFSEKHVCKSDNTLPEEGKNKAVYSTVTLEAQEIVWDSKNHKIDLTVILTIHGIKKTQKMTLAMSKKTPNQWHIKGDHKLDMKDFDITVKPFLVISVKGSIILKFDTVLDEVL